MVSFERQPEKKEALLMRRSGPCSEKARRGLQSWENPAQHKQKHGKEEREEGKEKKKKKDKKHEPWLVNGGGNITASYCLKVSLVTGNF